MARSARPALRATQLVPAAGAQLAGRAGPAAVAPGVQVVALAEVAGVAVLDGSARPAPRRPAPWPAPRSAPWSAASAASRCAKSCAMPRFSARLHGVQGVAPAVRIAGEVGLAHAADQRASGPAGRPAPRHRPGTPGCGPGTKVEGRPLVGDLDGPLGGQGRSRRSRRSRCMSSTWSSPSRARPVREPLARSRARTTCARLQLDGVALAIVEAHRLDAARSAPAPRPGRRWSPGRRRTAPGRYRRVAFGRAWRPKGSCHPGVLAGSSGLALKRREAKLKEHRRRIELFKRSCDVLTIQA